MSLALNKPVQRTVSSARVSRSRRVLPVVAQSAQAAVQTADAKKVTVSLSINIPEGETAPGWLSTLQTLFSPSEKKEEDETWREELGIHDDHDHHSHAGHMYHSHIADMKANEA